MSFTAGAMRKGLVQTQWSARLEVLLKSPLFVLDGAHNPAGISVLSGIEKSFQLFNRLILIFGAPADKDYRRMLRKIHYVLITRSTSESVWALPQLAASVHQAQRGRPLSQE